MYWFRQSVVASHGGTVEVAFTDSSLDLHSAHGSFAAALADLEASAGVRLAYVSQVHGGDVVEVDGPLDTEPPAADAVMTGRADLGVMVRVADCVPVILADADAGVIAAVHAGRPGLVAEVVPHAVSAMRRRGATDLTAWVGPHVCGRCYEVPEQMQADVAEQVPEALAETSWGTPALDIGAGVTAQLVRADVPVVQVAGCTREESRLHSYRRDGSRSGRTAGLVWRS